MSTILDFVNSRGRNNLLDDPQMWIAILNGLQVDPRLVSIVKSCIERCPSLFNSAIKEESNAKFNTMVKTFSEETYYSPDKIAEALDPLRRAMINDDHFIDGQNNHSILDDLYNSYFSKGLHVKFGCSSVERIKNGDYTFSLPVKRQIMVNGKQRAIYSFNSEEMQLLHLLAPMLYRSLDPILSDTQYCRANKGVNAAIKKIKMIYELDDKYIYKTDIWNYFDSIPVDKLLNDLKTSIEDPRLYLFLKEILSRELVSEQGRTVKDSHGVMTGIPISNFLSDFYLRDIDKYFEKQNVAYLRYCDDILIIGESHETIVKSRLILNQLLHNKGLSVNYDKEKTYTPGERFDYLGLSINGNEIDLSSKALKRTFKKIHELSHELRNDVDRGNISSSEALNKMILKINQQFFGQFLYKMYDELIVLHAKRCFSDWYFPLITTAESLHKIDLYIQEQLRFVYTGKFNKANYRKLPYNQLKQMGYKPLVPAFYKHKGKR